jgi:hypothetical protein
MSEMAIDGLNRFAQSAGLVRERAAYADIVAMSLRHLWVADC